MAITRLKGIRKRQARQELTQLGYKVIAHRQNYIKTDRMLQIAINRIAKLTNETPEIIYHRIKGEMHYLESYAHVRDDKREGKIIDDLVVCLKHADYTSPLHSDLNHTSDN